MRVRLVFMCALVLAVSGCSWNPDRDNRFDPNSRYYVTPPVRNHSPEIRALHMITNCRERSNNFCAFELHGRLYDADNNILYDSTATYLDTLFLGRPAFDPVSGEFVIERTQDDFPGQDLAQYIGDTLWMTVVDDSGAHARQWTVFHAPADNFPHAIYPRPADPSIDTVRTSHPMLVWQRWNGEPAACRDTSQCRDGCPYSVQIFFRDLYLVWDTTDVCATVDTIYVGDSLRSSNLEPNIFYTWYLTATDRVGNLMTSKPGTIYILLPTGQMSDMVARERQVQETAHER
jgi:hypothetical protein